MRKEEAAAGSDDDENDGGAPLRGLGGGCPGCGVQRKEDDSAPVDEGAFGIQCKEDDSGPIDEGAFGASTSVFGTETLQTKLIVGSVDDPLEREADEVAERVMRMADPDISATSENEDALQRAPTDEDEPLRGLGGSCAGCGVQRKEDDEEESTVQRAPTDEDEPLRGLGGSCAGCGVQRKEDDEEESTVQRAPTDEDDEKRASTPVAESIAAIRRDGGTPLPRFIRQDFERRFQQDFSQVRVHTGEGPATVAKQLRAKAFTLGRDVVFGQGRFQPETDAGKRLLAHELTHVVQQRGAPTSRTHQVIPPTQPVPFQRVRSQHGESAETEADFLGARIAHELETADVKPGPIPSTVKTAAQRVLGTDLSEAELHESNGTNAWSFSPNGLAVTEGNRAHFRAGTLETRTQFGRALLGHELVHLAQQERHGFRRQYKYFNGIKLPEVRFIPGTPSTVTIDGVPILKVTGQHISLNDGFDSTTLRFWISLTTDGTATQLRDLSFLNPMYPALRGSLVVSITDEVLLPTLVKDDERLTELPSYHTEMRLSSRVSSRFLRFGYPKKQSPTPPVKPPPTGIKTNSNSPASATPPTPTTAPKPTSPPSVAHSSLTPEQLIAKHTSLGFLDREGLGTDLASLARERKYAIIQSVVDLVGWQTADDVSLAALAAISDDLLLAIADDEPGRRLLDRMFDELTSGWVSSDEQTQASRILRAKTQRTSPIEYARAIQDASTMTVPYRSPGLTVFSPATMSVTRTANGSIRIKMPVAVMYDYPEEAKTLPVEVFTSGLEIPENTIVKVRLHDLGGKVVVGPALLLVQIGNQSDAETVSKIAETTALALTLGTGGIGGAIGKGSTFARGLAVADRVAFGVGTTASILHEHRGWIIANIRGGKEFVDALELIQTTIAIYGLTRVATQLPRLVSGLRAKWITWTQAYREANSLTDAQRQLARELGLSTEVLLDELEQASVSAARNASPNSRASLEAFLRRVWVERSNILARRTNIYRLYSTEESYSPSLSGSNRAYLEEISDIAQRRSPKAFSAPQRGAGQGGGNQISPVVAPGSNNFDVMERTFFHFYREGTETKAASLVTQRVYVNVNADQATFIMRRVVREIIDSPMEFPGVIGGKITGPAVVSSRPDAIVIYTRDTASSKQVVEYFARLRAQQPKAFLAGTPPMTNAVIPGVGAGAEPPVPNESFGSYRSDIIERALRTVVANGGNEAAFVSKVEELLREGGVNPQIPHTNLPE
jgi:hypothetical protein